MIRSLQPGDSDIGGGIGTAGLMTAHLGKAIEEARSRANAATLYANEMGAASIRSQWITAVTALEAYLRAEPSTSLFQVIEAFDLIAEAFIPPTGN